MRIKDIDTWKDTMCITKDYVRRLGSYVLRVLRVDSTLPVHHDILLIQEIKTSTNMF